MLPLMLLCSCAPKVIIRDGWGGTGGTALKNTAVPAHGEMYTVAVQQEESPAAIVSRAQKGWVNKPGTDTSAKARVQSVRKERYPRIDTLPPASMMNGADSMLLAARNDFIKAEQH